MAASTACTTLLRMSIVKPESPVDDRLRCRLCGDVIGVYEPLVHVLDDAARHTSRAADPGLYRAGGAHYHVDCYDRLGSSSDR
jgi:hypothetical protein